MLTGSCLCGAIRYEVSTIAGQVGHCHCSMCRKAHGAAFGTYATVAWVDFCLVDGEDRLASYESSPGVTRTFCKTCGSTLQFIPADRPNFGLAIGTLDSDPGIEPTYQIWVRDKAPWWRLQDGLDTHETQ